MTYGATPQEWAHFDLVLGLTSDLLPVVSNPHATISPSSKMKGLGKTPSGYNGERHVVGIAQWTSKQATSNDIVRWSAQPDYGICIQTRTVRAIDVDVEDAQQAQAIREAINAHIPDLPCRTRGSNKFLLAFTLPGDYAKRIIRTSHGIIEFLATGQQFIAAGTHPSGRRYEWRPANPDMPVVSADAFERLWGDLARGFAQGPDGASAGQVVAPRAARIADAALKDPVAQHLVDKGLVLSTERDGRLHITCPWAHEHTTESADSATSYFPAHTGGFINGQFKCLHAHCAGRSTQDFKDAIEYAEPDPFDDFDVLPVEPGNVAPLPSGSDDVGPHGDSADAASVSVATAARFPIAPIGTFAQGTPPSWIVKGVLPQAALAVVFGESGSGKSFFMLDLIGAIAQGKDWRGLRTKQGAVVYIAAEGAGGFRNRAKAYAHQHGVDLATLPIGVIADAPNFMQVADVKAVLASVKAFGPVSVIVVDTFSQVMPGANENAGEDVGKAIAHCKALHKHTGALVVLVHHSGKDTSKGARGWSGLRAAADAEIEVVRADDDRVATVSKQKDGEDGAEFGFRLLTVPVGVDSDGEEVTSCVVEHVEGANGKAPVSSKKRQKALKGLPAQVFKLAAEQVGDGMEEEALVEKIVAEMPPRIAANGRDMNRQHVSRALKSLIACRLLGLDGLNVVMGET